MRSRGVSLIEILVVIAVIAVLIGILVPGLGLVRSRAQSVKAQSALRSHAASFGLYQADYDGMHPYITEPGVENVINVPGMGELDNVFFFEAHNSWHLVLAGLYTSEPLTSEIFFPIDEGDGDPPGWPLRTNVHYPCAFIARPGFWNPETRSVHGQFAPTRGAEVRYPSSKSLLVLSWPYIERVAARGVLDADPLLVAMSDGSVNATAAAQRVGGYERGDGAEFMSDGAVHFNDAPPVLHTLDGVYGRDIRAE